MTVIKSLADELREKMREQPGAKNRTASIEQPVEPVIKHSGQKKAGKPPPPKLPQQLETLFAELAAYELTGNEKLLIRLENRTVLLMKQLKIVKGIDMNKLIAYSVDTFFKERPELIEYIKSSLKNLDL